MAYVVIGILFLLVLGAGVTILVMANTKESAPATGDDETADATPFSGPDHTPVGDTAQHAGQQDEQGQTVTPNDADRRGGTGAPTSGPHAQGRATRGEAEEPTDLGRFKRDPIGGEGEGETAADVPNVPHPGRR
jgi:hypothetical protein